MTGGKRGQVTDVGTAISCYDSIKVCTIEAPTEAPQEPTQEPPPEQPTEPPPEVPTEVPPEGGEGEGPDLPCLPAALGLVLVPLLVKGKKNG